MPWLGVARRVIVTEDYPIRDSVKRSLRNELVADRDSRIVPDPDKQMSDRHLHPVHEKREHFLAPHLFRVEAVLPEIVDSLLGLVNLFCGRPVLDELPHIGDFVYRHSR